MVSFRSLSFTAISLTGGQGSPQLQAGQIGGLKRASSQDLIKNQQPTPQMTQEERKQKIAEMQITRAETDDRLAILDKKVAETKNMVAALNKQLTEMEQKKRLVNPQQPQQ
ncbi:hypothetical protein BDF22DRAFT_750268 [Syncephalis plumigaleata]|nr:hypothetical protein BDF22DRAFT_750268 [Syncephalis plumigaleata]